MAKAAQRSPQSRGFVYKRLLSAGPSRTEIRPPNYRPPSVPQSLPALIRDDRQVPRSDVSSRTKRITVAPRTQGGFLDRVACFFSASNHAVRQAVRVRNQGINRLHEHVIGDIST